MRIGLWKNFLIFVVQNTLLGNKSSILNPTCLDLILFFVLRLYLGIRAFSNSPVPLARVYLSLGHVKRAKTLFPGGIPNAIAFCFLNCFSFAPYSCCRWSLPSKLETFDIGCLWFRFFSVLLRLILPCCFLLCSFCVHTLKLPIRYVEKVVSVRS